jgi:hypothetical protein
MLGDGWMLPIVGNETLTPFAGGVFIGPPQQSQTDRPTRILQAMRLCQEVIGLRQDYYCVLIMTMIKNGQL